jgi:hypothetical protein
VTLSVRETVSEWMERCAFQVHIRLAAAILCMMRSPRPSRPEILVPQRVDICFAGREEPCKGWIVRISIVGADIEAPEAPPIGSRVDLFAELQDGEVVLAGRVQWATPGQFGVQFGPLGVRETHAILETAHSGGVSWELRLTRQPPRPSPRPPSVRAPV